MKKMAVERQEQNPQARARFIFLLIVLICTIPLSLAWYMARHPELISAQSNYGQLIVPPVPVAYRELSLFEADGKPGIDELKGRWGLIYVVGEAECLASCRDTIEKTHRIWLLLNKDLSRVRRVLLAGSPDLSDASLRSLYQEDPTLLTGRIAGELWSRLSPLLMAQGGNLLLMDPLGNVLMQYPAGFDPYGVLKDLKHLLKASQIG
jgi:hypothetical protein